MPSPWPPAEPAPPWRGAPRRPRQCSSTARAFPGRQGRCPARGAPRPRRTPPDGARRTRRRAPEAGSAGRPSPPSAPPCRTRTPSVPPQRSGRTRCGCAAPPCRRRGRYIQSYAFPPWCMLLCHNKSLHYIPFPVTFPVLREKEFSGIMQAFYLRQDVIRCRKRASPRR